MVVVVAALDVLWLAVIDLLDLAPDFAEGLHEVVEPYLELSLDVDAARVQGQTISGALLDAVKFFNMFIHEVMAYLFKAVGLDAQFLGGNKALRQATINWTCWSFEDIDRLTPHFLSVGKTVCVEWGWVYGNNGLRNVRGFIGPSGIRKSAYENYSR